MAAGAWAGRDAGRLPGVSPAGGQVSALQLNRATLERQLLLGRARLGVIDGVRRVAALQAQDAVNPYVALWNRLDGFDPADLDRAFAEQAVVKATLMRVTLHAVSAEDYRLFHAAMQPTLRAARLHDRRFRSAGLPIDEYEALVPEVLAFAAQPRSNAEVEAWLDERLGQLPKPSVWWAMRQAGPFIHAPTGGAWSFGPRPAYLAAPQQAGGGDWEASARALVRRYLQAFGPASIEDVAQFALLQRTLLRPLIEAMSDELVRLPGPGGREVLDVPGAALPDEETPAPPRLLPMWDSILLAYADRSRIIPPGYRRLAIRSNGDVLPTLLVDGQVAGVWRPVAGGIEATAFHPLAEEAWQGLADEAAGLVRFLAPREANPYARYGRWWAGLPAAEVRTLGSDGA